MTVTTTGTSPILGVVVGIDVGKTRLDVSAGGGQVQTFVNDREGLAALLEWLGGQQVGLVVCEPTGGYEEPLVQSLRRAGSPVHLAHPNKVRAFAHASGRMAKTDRLDAQVLSHYGEVFASAEVSQPEPEREELQALLRRRRQLVDQRVQERNRLDRAWNPAVRASTQRHINWLDQEIAALDQEYREALESSEELARRADLYRSVPGIGELTAAILVADLPELGRGEGKGLCSLVGLAPWSRDSGQQRGIPGGARRTWLGAPGLVHGGSLAGPETRRAAPVLSGTASKGQGRQSGPGSGNAQAPAAPERHRPPWHLLDAQSHPTRPKPLTQTLTNNTDTPAKTGCAGQPVIPAKTGSADQPVIPAQAGIHRLWLATRHRRWRQLVLR